MADIFVFTGEKDVILDFNPANNVLILWDDLWSAQLSTLEVIRSFGNIEQSAVVLEFGDGNRLTRNGCVRGQNWST
ncbi:MAG: hypothetical protein AAF742_09300 [Pseudomonadota bacterium]